MEDGPQQYTWIDGQSEGLPGESDILPTSSRYNLNVIAKKNRGVVETNVVDLLSTTGWSATTYAQFWGIKLGADDRRKSLVCESMPFMIEFIESEAGENRHIVDAWKYRDLCEGFAHVIDHVKVNDHNGKSPLNVTKLLDAYTNTVPVFALVEEEGHIRCPLMSGASACGLKVCMYLPLFDASSGCVGVLELAVSKAQDAHTVYSDIIKGSKTGRLKFYNQVVFGRLLFAKFSEPRLAADNKKKSYRRKGKMHVDDSQTAAKLIMTMSSPVLATKTLWSGKEESRKRGLSAAEGTPPEAGLKRLKLFEEGSSAGGGVNTGTPSPLNAIAMDFLALKVRILEEPMVASKPFKKKVISYNLVSPTTIKETVEECMGVEPGAYRMCYHEVGSDLIDLGSDEEIEGAIAFSREKNNNELKIEVSRVM